MENYSIQKQNYFQEGEIDILSILLRLWKKKKFIITITAVFSFLGLMVALFSPKEYISSCTFIPQTANKSNSGGTLSALASLAGVNFGNMGSGESISPLIYPQIIDNIDFKKELMYSKFKFSEFEESITLIDYHTNPKYAKNTFFSRIKKYTLNLPKTIFKLFKSNTKGDTIIQTGDVSYKSYSVNEINTLLLLNKLINISLDEKHGYVTITAKMSEPLVAAQLCQTTFDLLQKYVTNFKLLKVKDHQSFIYKRYKETKADFEDKQKKLALFKDANKSISSSHALIELERLNAEFNLSNMIYTEMSKQLLQADIHVKEDTPLLTMIKPVVVPFIKSKPRRALILFCWTVMGVLCASSIVLGCDYLHKNGYDNYFVKRISY